MNNRITYTLYFSNFCKNSQKFRQELSRSRYNGKIKLVCVDPAPGTSIRPALPPKLKKVPSLFIKENGNETQFTGQAAFRWLTGHTSNGKPLQPKRTADVVRDSTGLMTYDQELAGANNYSLLDGTGTNGSYGLLNQDQRIDTPTESTTTDFKKLQGGLPNPADISGGNFNGMNSGMNGNGMNNNGMGNGMNGNGMESDTSKNPYKEQVKQDFEALMAQRQAEERSIRRPI